MATADSVKTKLQGLIDTANATTGKEDATLTAAVSSLVDGFGSGGGNAEAYLAMINGTDVIKGGCTVVIPEGVTRVPKYLYSDILRNGIFHLVLSSGVKKIGEQSFFGIGMSAADRGSTVRLNDDLEIIGANAFSNASNCVFKNIPSSLVSIGQYAFSNGSSALSSGYSTSIDLPVIQNIATRAFQNFNFTGTDIHIGSSITSIGGEAFMFKNKPTFTLTIDRAEDAISGAPWGATNATIVWAGDA